jgi:hypothetical protein
MNAAYGSPGEREVIIIIGKTRYGKSTWLNKYLANKPRKFTFDPFQKAQAEYLDADTLIERHEKGLLRNPQPFSIGSRHIPDIDLLASVAFLNGHSYFSIEECGVAFYKGERLSEPLQEAIFLGGHQWLSIVLVAQRAVSIPIELRSQATRFISFLQTEKNDVRWCEDYLGDRFKEVGTLEKFECLDYENNTVSRYKILPLYAKDSVSPGPDLRNRQTTDIGQEGSNGASS